MASAAMAGGGEPMKKTLTPASLVSRVSVLDHQAFQGEVVGDERALTRMPRPLATLDQVVSSTGR